MSAAGSVPDDVPVRDAATVVLLRDGSSGVEVWLLTRVTNMAFAAGMSVFPGGRVEDADADLPASGGDLASMASRFGCDERTVRGFLGAAVRETFEETGVLLCTPPLDPDVGSGVELDEARTQVEAGARSFADLLDEYGVTLDPAALHPWSRWITPAGEARRYDTRFFVGALPAGAVARDVTSESSQAEWVSIAEAIEQAQRGERRLMPPTLVTLAALGDFATVTDALAAADGNVLDPVAPRLLRGDDGSVSVELPDGRVLPVRSARPRR